MTWKINKIKIILVNKGKTNKWLTGQLGKTSATICKWLTKISLLSREVIMLISDVHKDDICCFICSVLIERGSSCD